MAKLVLNDIGAGFQSRQTLNENFLLIQQAVEKLLSRDGEYPNNMMASLDMNGHDVLNARTIFTDDLVYRGIDLTESLDLFADNYEHVLGVIDDIIQIDNNIAQIALDIDQMHQHVIAMEENVEDMEDNVLLMRNDTEALTDKAEIAASTSTSLLPTLQNSLAMLQGIANGVMSAQAQANAVLGMGLGNSYVDQDGHLIFTVYDGYFDDVEIDSDGHLVLEWTYVTP